MPSPPPADDPRGHLRPLPRRAPPTDEPASEQARGAPVEDLMQQEPLEVARRAGDVGERRLGRGWFEILITGFLGGLEVSLGALAAMVVTGVVVTVQPGWGLYGALALGGLFFPVGFLLVMLGHSELFTENFLIPVIAVIHRDSTPGDLGKLWIGSLLGNVAACAGMALLLSVPDAIGEPLRNGYKAYAAYKLALDPVAVLASAALAGMAMTALTWVLVSVRETVGRILAIGAVGYLLYAANLSHSIVGAAILFVGAIPAGHTIGDVLRWVAIAAVGNLIGGVGLVTVVRTAQAHQQARAEA